MPRIMKTCLAMLFAVPAFAGVTDDAIQLSASGVSEEVLLAWAQRQEGVEIAPKDIIALKDGKVSDRVVVALIKRGGESYPEAPAAESRETEYVEREHVRYVEPTTSSVSYAVPAASYYSYSDPYYPSYYSRPYYYYPRNSFSFSFGRPYYYHSYPRYYSRGYYPRYYGYGGYGHRHHRHHRGGFSGGFRIGF